MLSDSGQVRCWWLPICCSHQFYHFSSASSRVQFASQQWVRKEQCVQRFSQCFSLCTFCVTSFFKLTFFFSRIVYTTPYNDHAKNLFFNKHFVSLFLKKIPWEKSHLHSQPLMWISKLSSGASCFHWSSLKCFSSWIGVPVGQMHLIGDDLERYTSVYIRSYTWNCMLEHKPIIKSKQLQCL